MAAATTAKVKLPADVVTTLLPKIQGNSTIATLSPRKPQTFSEHENIIFTPTAEAEVVEEGATKSSYEVGTSFVQGVRVKLQTTTRVTEELQWADEDDQLEIIDNIQKDQAGAIGRALDYVVYHGINPAKKTALASSYPKLVGATGVHTIISVADELANLNAMKRALVDYEFNGIALSRLYACDLSELRVPATGAPLFPSIPMNLKATTFEGLDVATSNTVNGSILTGSAATKVRAIMGDFSMIGWGMIRDMTAEIIPYGDPDNTGVDLKSAGQIAYRTQAFLCYGILDPGAFAVLKEA